MSTPVVIGIVFGAIIAGWVGAWGWHLCPTPRRAIEATGISLVLWFLLSALITGFARMLTD